jgi:hypothetical protein
MTDNHQQNGNTKRSFTQAEVDQLLQAFYDKLQTERQGQDDIPHAYGNTHRAGGCNSSPTPRGY